MRRSHLALGIAVTCLAAGVWAAGCSRPPSSGSSLVGRGELARSETQPSAQRPRYDADPPSSEEVGPDQEAKIKTFFRDPAKQYLGDPLDGLSDAQMLEYRFGLSLFLLSWDFGPRPTGEGGLGPLFNENQCVACHSMGGVGGSGPVARSVVRMAIADVGSPLSAVTGFNDLSSTTAGDPFALGGPLRQGRAGGGFAVEADADLSNLPGKVLLTSRRVGSPTIGSGLLSAIPDADIEAYAALQPTMTASMSPGVPLGISGRPNILQLDGQRRVGRLGWKADQPDNQYFVADATVQELGLSHSRNPFENRPNGPAIHVGGPGEPALDLTDEQFNALVAFCNRIAPPLPVNSTLSEVAAGKKIFLEAGCAVCHHTERPGYAGYVTGNGRDRPLPTPLLRTETALHNRPVKAYTDLLLHDMGEGLADGFLMGQAGGSEWRTAPLWGLRFKDAYLHDGRATYLDQAIRMHASPGSEANGVIANYMTLSALEKVYLIHFLLSL